ncbi:MerR-like DNA binding protein [Streptomyces cavourensis]|nr:MerR-like DNA binding protein [Streptomyces cavourensis]GGU94145.1 hypothetical protein GCM10010498_61880 [Streptomyces cavourensis]
MADWPIAEVARMSGVTARTLRHYDEIGPLPGRSAWADRNGLSGSRRPSRDRRLRPTGGGRPGAGSCGAPGSWP